ncbi:MAG: VCBS repeat-containing protein [Planctomycetes bacterium]|nr:VCBS repeat-containing protein [Planctomycetota bacterium]
MTEPLPARAPDHAAPCPTRRALAISLLALLAALALAHVLRPSAPTPAPAPPPAVLPTASPGAPPTPAAAAAPPTLDVEITGADYRWHIRYPGPDGRLRTPDDPETERHLRLPAHTRVTLHLHSRDFVYTFALPHLRKKEIAVPDLEFRLTFDSGPPATHDLLGDPLCGLDHPDLLGTLTVETPERFAAALAACAPPPGGRIAVAADPVQVAVPPDALAPAWLDARAAAQRADLARAQVFTGFSFADRRAASGIAFRHRIVDDAGRDYKPVHYDHGTALAAADVDADGRLDLFFVNQAGASELWRNAGDGRFENVTAAAGIALPGRLGVAASFADVDNDGDADLYVTTVRGGNALFLNDGAGRFADASAASGLAYVGHSSAALFFDYDRDGRLDLFLCNVGKYTGAEERTLAEDFADPWPAAAGPRPRFFLGFLDAFAGHLKAERSEPSRLFHNQGGARFADVTAAVGLASRAWCGDALPFDANEDGWPDLYVLNMQGRDEYWENLKGARFVERSRALFPLTPWGTMGAASLDVDADGRLDLLLTDMHSDMSQVEAPEREKRKADMQWPEALLATANRSLFGNAVFRNAGGGRWEEIGDEIGAETFWPWGVSAGDLNADGFADLFVTAGMSYPYRYGPNSVLLSNRGRGFLDAEFALGIEPRGAAGTGQPWFGLDAAGADRAHRDAAGRSGRVVVWAARSSRSSAILDLDGDGDLDVVTNEFNAPPQVLVSDLAQQRPVRALAVRLRGTVSNRDGLGARVTVRAGGRSEVKAHDGKSGYLAQSRMPLWFGLGAAAAADAVEVLWPSGRRSTLAGPLAAGATVELVEPAQDAPAPAGGPPAAAAPPSAAVDAARPEWAPYEVFPGEDIQEALDHAAENPLRKLVRVHAGAYRPTRPRQALLHFNARHDGITLEAVGAVTLTAANPERADRAAPGYPALVNHVVFFGDGVTRRTRLRGFTITGANGFRIESEEVGAVEPSSSDPRLAKDQFFYSDGGGIKLFGRAYPTIEGVVIAGNYAAPCGGGVSIEHRSFYEGEALFRNCIFRDNRARETGAAADLLIGSSARFENCLFVGNVSNVGDARGGKGYHAEHGSGALTVFERSRCRVIRCTFVDNGNGVDDEGDANLYLDSIFWKNARAGGAAPGGRFEIDIFDGKNVVGCFLRGALPDLSGALDRGQNVFDAPDPDFDGAWRPRAPEYAEVGYRPVAE